MNAESSLTEFQAPGQCDMTPSSVTKTESDCLATAQQLHQVLKSEADILKRFAKADLLQLISRKESLINELGQQLECLKNADGQTLSLSEPLKDLLGKIDALNRSNSVFIQRSLAHWQDFLSVLIPSGYRPPGPGSGSGAHSAVPRGFAFSREV